MDWLQEAKRATGPRCANYAQAAALIALAEKMEELAEEQRRTNGLIVGVLEVLALAYDKDSQAIRISTLRQG